MLSLRHLSKSYVRGKPVLNDINLEIAARGITAIIGPSGTGKSTLIRCINRLVEPLTVMENVLSGRLGYVSAWRAWRRKFPPADIARAFELLEVVGLSGFA